MRYRHHLSALRNSLSGSADRVRMPWPITICPYPMVGRGKSPEATFHLLNMKAESAFRTEAVLSVPSSTDNKLGDRQNRLALSSLRRKAYWYLANTTPPLNSR